MGWKKVTWNYTEAGHGKGPADGIGAAVKRRADAIVAKGKDLPTPKTLYEELKKIQSSINLFFIEKDEIDVVDALLPDQLLTVRGTMKIHQVGLLNFR